MRITLKDLAKETGYSITTISRALAGYDDVSEQTRKFILDVAERLGYQPNQLARQLQSQRTNTIGLILPAYGPRFSDAFFSEFLSGVGTEASSHSYDLLLATQIAGTEGLPVYKRIVGSGRVDGMILLRTQQHDPRIEYLHSAGLPFVAHGRSETDFEFSYVDVDGELGLLLATRHFISLGHRRIAFVAAMPDLMLTRHRLAGYYRALAEHDLPADPALVVYGDLTQQSGLELGLSLLQMDRRPTAIVASNDLMALGVVMAARQLGLRVGVDVAISGYDDTPLAAHADPPLTSVNCLVFESGRQACRQLIELIQADQPVVKQLLLQPNLVIRASSGTSRD